MRQPFIGIVVIVICGKGFSQVHEQVYDNMPMYIIRVDTMYRDSVRRFIEGAIPSPPADTIPCIMLICDTTSEPLMDFSQNVSYQKEFHLVYWIKGYSVWDSVYSNGFYIESSPPITYLSENKQPISKNIIVWLTKQIIK